MSEVTGSMFQQALAEGLTELLGVEAVTALTEELRALPVNTNWLEGMNAWLKTRFGQIPAQGIAFRAGRLAFLVYVQRSKRLSLSTLAFRLQPVLQRMADGLSQVKDQLVCELPIPLSIDETPEAYVLKLINVPLVCVYGFCGFFQEFFEWVSNGKTFSFHLEETTPCCWQIYFQKSPVDHG